MIYKSDGFCWEEVLELPEDSSLLVRAVGTFFVKQISDSLKEFKRTHTEFVFYTLADRKDDVQFYVRIDSKCDVANFVKSYCQKNK